MIDGVPTMAGWVQYLAGVGQMGALGVVGAFAFWLVQRRWGLTMRSSRNCIAPPSTWQKELAMLPATRCNSA